MKQIIVMGHGGYAQGIKSNLGMLTGVPANMHFLDLGVEDDFSAFQDRFDELVLRFKEEELLFACDLLGASPFRVAAMRCAMHPTRCAVVAGLNAMAFIELGMNSDGPLYELAKKAVETTKDSAVLLDMATLTTETDGTSAVRL